MKKPKIFLADLTPKKVSPIRVRILRIWQTDVYGDKNKIKSIQLVFIDEMNTKIQGSVDKELVNKFLDILLEGSTIILSDYLVAENDNEYKYANHPYKIKFQPQTTVKNIDNFKGSINGFKFISFGDVLTGKVADNEIVDVIGYVVNVGEIIPGEYKGKPNKRRIVTLEDLQGQTIECTLWDSFVDEFCSFIKNNEDEALIIIMIMQFGKIRAWNKKFAVGNAFFGTRLFINRELSEILDFKAMLLRGKGYKQESAYKVGSISTQIAKSGPEAFWANKKCVTLDQIPLIYKETDCVALATIQNVCANKPWFYIACRKCARKVIPTDDSKSNLELKNAKSTWKCPFCGPNISAVYPRYKIQILVVDHTGSATFILFDKDVMKFISTSAYQIRGRLTDAQETFPDELEELNGMTLMFDFKVSDFNLENNHKVYTVSKVCKDESVVQAFLKLSESNGKPSSSKVFPSCDLNKSNSSNDSLGKMPIAEEKPKGTVQASPTWGKRNFNQTKSNEKLLFPEVEESHLAKKSKTHATRKR